MNKSILQIIREEISNFYSDWQMSDEPSMADKYYEKNLGINTKESENKIDGELVGYVDTVWGRPLQVPIPIYKNPRSLKYFNNSIRGILLSNGDIYLAQTNSAMHDDMLKMLSEKGLVSRGAALNYSIEYPEEFVAIQRAGNLNKFAQSMAYDKFPIYYETMFDEANKKQPFEFSHFQVNEQLDPNNMISYAPDGYDRGIVNEKS